MALRDKFDLTTFSCVLFIRCMILLSYFSIFSFYNLGLMPDVAMKKNKKDSSTAVIWPAEGRKLLSLTPEEQRNHCRFLKSSGIARSGCKQRQSGPKRCYEMPMTTKERKGYSTYCRKEMYRNVSWSRRNDVTATSKEKSWSDQNLELQSSLSHTAQSDKCNSFGGGRQSLGSIYWASRAELPGFLQLWYVDFVFRLSMQECTCPIISTKQSIWMQALAVAKVQPSSRQYTDIYIYIYK